MIARLACLLLLVAGLASAQPNEGSPTKVLDRAEFVAVEGEDAGRPPPPGAAWKPVTLPDDWSRSRPGFKGVVWYRIRFQHDDPPPRVYAIHLPRFNATRIGVLVNGQLVGGSLGLPDPRVRLFYQPLYFSVPAALLRIGDNTLLIRLAGDADFRHGLSRVYYGWSGTVVLQQILRQRQQLVPFVVGGFVTLAIGLFALWLWRQERANPGPLHAATGWFALGCVLFGVPGVINVTIGFGSLTPAREALHVLYAHAFAPPMAVALAQIAGLRSRWLAAGLALPVAIAAAAPLAVGTGVLPRITLVLSGLYIVAWILLAFAAMARPAHDRGTRLILGGATIATGAAAGHDLAHNLGWIDYDSVTTMQYAAPALAIALFVLLAQRYARATALVRRRREELEAEVAARTREIEEAQARLREVAQREAVLQERARIMGDMHDGLGGSLVSALSLAQSGRARPGELEARLGELLLELRLTVDSLSLPEGDLVSVIASVRHRLREAIEASGVALAWEVEDLPAVPSLTPQKLRELQLYVTEAMVNALRHSGAARLSVSARRTNGEIEVRIADDGRGFESGAAVAGQGLAGLSRRAAAIGATHALESAPGAGTTVTLRIPAPA